MTSRVILTAVLAVVPGAIAMAQDWSELATLSFTPIVSDRAVAARTTGASTNPSGSASAEDDLAAAQVIARIQAAVAAIDSEKAENGEYSPSLIPLYRTLAGIYLEIDGYGDAIDVLEQAQQVVRRHEGLYSLDQAALIEEMIDIDLAVTPNEESLERENVLRDLVERNPGDPRNAGILTRMAGRQQDVADYVLIHGAAPELTLNVSMNGLNPRRSSPPTARSIAGSMLRQARASYGYAMRAALFDGQAELSQLFELEDSIIDTYYFELMNPQLRRGWGPSRGQGAGSLYVGATHTLEAKLSNIRRFSGSPEAVTRALIEIADWDLMFSRFGHAMQGYQDALDYLREESGDDKRVAAVFSPEAPVPLPALAANANVFDDQSNVRGYFDVEIEINRFGGVRDIVVTGRSENATDAIERRLRRFVFLSRFRPRYVNGEWRRTDRFALRYEFGYTAS